MTDPASLLKSLKDKAYRDTFVETEIETIIPFQIRSMRKRLGWNQKQLAEKAGMTQARISVLESPSYEGAVNVKTFVKLASAFDVGLIVRFAPFGEVVDWSSRLSRESHEVPNYEMEIAAIENEPESATAPVTTGFREGGRIQSKRRPAEPKEFSGGEERSRIGADAGQGQEVKQRLVLVEWVDSYGCSANWQKLDVVSVAPMICRSVGWLAYDGQDCKVIVPHLTEQDHPYIPQQGCGDMTIPTRAILRVVDLPISN